MARLCLQAQSCRHNLAAVRLKKATSVEARKTDWFLFNNLDKKDGRFGQRVEVELVRSDLILYMIFGAVIRICQ